MLSALEQLREEPVSRMPSTSVCHLPGLCSKSWWTSTWHSTNSVSSGNLYSHPEVAVYEACPHLTTSNSPPDSRATFWSISLCRNSIQHTGLHITVCVPHNAMCAAIDTSFPVLMRIDQWASVTSDTVRSLSTYFSEKQNLSVAQWYSIRHVIDTAQ